MKEDKIYLTHILESIENIETFVEPGEEEFFNSKLIQHAVIRNLEVIGEATKKISDQMRNDKNDIPWREMAGLRDVLIHNYFGIDLRIGNHCPSSVEHQIHVMGRSLSRPEQV